MTDAPTSATRLIALLGNPVAHSVSPIFQNAAFRHAGVDGVYLALRCESDSVPALIRGIAGAGGGGNITVPHKEVAAGALERATAAVERTGACNTYWMAEGQLWGDNTDVVGSREAVRSLLGSPAKGARVLLVGGGGAARAALAAFIEEEVAEVVLLNRTRARATALAERFGGGRTSTSVAGGESELPDGAFDLVVNATPLGLHAGDPAPISDRLVERVRAGFDMAYRPGGTEWVRRLQAAGLPASDGREMLLWQGAAAFERWWQIPAPIEVMRQALESSVAA